MSNNVTEIIVGGRQTGKTYELVKICAAHEGVIMVADGARRLYVVEMMRKALQEQYPDQPMEWIGRKAECTVIVARRHREGHMFTFNHVFVDDANRVLERMMGISPGHLDAMSVDGCLVRTAQAKKIQDKNYQYEWGGGHSTSTANQTFVEMDGRYWGTTTEFTDLNQIFRSWHRPKPAPWWARAVAWGLALHWAVRGG